MRLQFIILFLSLSSFAKTYTLSELQELALKNSFEAKKNDHPLLLKEYLGKRVSIETLIILDELVEFTKNWNRLLPEDYIWYDIKKLMKNYKRFLTIDKNQYRIQVLKLIEEANNEYPKNW